MKIIDHVHESGGKIISFKSHCGGLVAPESDNNPWHYKISWNPRNIMMAGKSGAVFKKNNEIVKIDYPDLFTDCPNVFIPGLSDLVYYSNRDSLSYIPLYGLEETETFIRTTLRHKDFCIGWNYIVKAGLTDQSVMELKSYSSIYELVNYCISKHTPSVNISDYFENFISENHRPLVMKLFEFLGLLNEEKIPSNAKTIADVMQYLLENKLALLHSDKDMIVMLHEFEYQLKDKITEIKSSLIVKGEDSMKTAMAKTVGLPLGIAAKLILNGNIQLKGLHIPTSKEIYRPVLKELEINGIKFHEEKNNGYEI